MPYYAIAVGREQKITEDWLECKKIVNGYSGAKYRRFLDYDEAVKYIENISLEFQNKLLNEFELEQKMIPAFTNSLIGIKNAKTEIYIGSSSIDLPQKEKCPVFGDETYTISKFAMTASSLISTRYKLNLPIDETAILKKGDSSLINYLLTTTSTDYLTANKQSMIIRELIKSFKYLIEANIKTVSIYTDSNYLLLLLKNNIFSNLNAYINNVENYNAINELYGICYKFNGIYLSYYSGSIIPDKLKYVQSKSHEINKDSLVR